MTDAVKPQDRIADSNATAGAVEVSRALGATIRNSIATSRAMKPTAFADVYASVLSRVAVRSLFEIGIHKGGSIRMWRDLLGTSAKITCMDIKPDACATVRGIADRVIQGSQTDAELLGRIGSESGPFDVIIDDGSHQNPHMVFSLEALFDHVAPGGAYVIEDMFTSYWPRYQGGYRTPGTLVEHVKHLIDMLFMPFTGDKYKDQFLDQRIPDIQQSRVSLQIDSIEFFTVGIVVVYKRAGT